MSEPKFKITVCELGPKTSDRNYPAENKIFECLGFAIDLPKIFGAISLREAPSESLADVILRANNNAHEDK